jgi:ABC-2 type transport system permease protein
MKSETLIAKHFWNTTFKNKSVFLLLFFIGLMLIYAIVTGFVNFQSQNAMRAKYQAEARKDWLGNPDKDPHRMAHYGNFAFRPKSALSVFDFGMESFLGSTIFLEAHVQNTTNFSEAEFSTGLLRFGEISVAMILQILLPLLIFFLGFNTIATERENGTLKIILSQGVSWHKLLIGKSLGIISVIMTIYLPVILLTIFLWLFLQKMQISLDETYRLLAMLLAYFIYLAIFCVIAVLVSAVSRTSKIALTSLIGIWLLLTILIPKASQALGAYLYEIPSKAAFQSEIESDVIKTGDSHNPDDPHYKSLKDSVLAAYKVDSVQKLPFNYGGFVMKEGEKISANIYNVHLAALRKIYEKQNSFTRFMAFVDPFLAIKNLSMALAGTDYNSYTGFQDQAEQYRYHISQEMNELQIKYMVKTKKSNGIAPKTLSRKHWEEMHDFEYISPKIASVFSQEILSILSLIFWSMLLWFSIHQISKTLKAI